jgi:single-stranded DNA-binding protein
MSRCLNKATMIGYLGADPEIRTISSGARVYVEGEIDYRSYETNDGDTRWTTEIKATDVLGEGAMGGGQERRASRSTRSRVAVGAGAELQLAL